MFNKVIEIVVAEALLKGKRLGVDTTTLEANASMRSLLHNVSGKSYRDYVKGLMAEDKNEPDDRGPYDVARFDRRRKNKKLSNKGRSNPHNPDAKITKMKDGRTHFSEKCEHAVDLDTGAVVSVTVQGADLGDTTTLDVTLEAAEANLEGVMEKILEQRNSDPRDRGRPHKRDLIQKVVADKGYHCSAVCARLKEQGIHLVISERKTGRRKWDGKSLEQSAVYGNRANIKSNLGKRLMRKRGELVERAFTHYLDGGGMRQVWLKGHDIILKRLLIQVAGFNLGLLMRKVVGAGTPRGGGDLKKAFEGIFWAFKDHFSGLFRWLARIDCFFKNCFQPPNKCDHLQLVSSKS